MSTQTSIEIPRRDTELPAEMPVELTREYTGQPETSRMWDTYRKGFSASAGNLPEDLQDVADAIVAFVMPASVAAASGADFGKTWTPISGWAQES
ncbi:MAG: hypothetical protein LLG08_02440 [Actinomycetia bacterium]|nr:hypothetical protein [Actinomycetes bacterium]